MSQWYTKLTPDEETGLAEYQYPESYEFTTDYGEKRRLTFQKSGEDYFSLASGDSAIGNAWIHQGEKYYRYVNGSYYAELTEKQFTVDRKRFLDDYDNRSVVGYYESSNDVFYRYLKVALGKKFEKNQRWEYKSKVVKSNGEEGDLYFNVQIYSTYESWYYDVEMDFVNGNPVLAVMKERKQSSSTWTNTHNELHPEYERAGYLLDEDHNIENLPGIKVTYNPLAYDRVSSFVVSVNGDSYPRASGFWHHTSDGIAGPIKVQCTGFATYHDYNVVAKIYINGVLSEDETPTMAAGDKVLIYFDFTLKDRIPIFLAEGRTEFPNVYVDGTRIADVDENGVPLIYPGDHIRCYPKLSETQENTTIGARIFPADEEGNQSGYTAIKYDYSLDTSDVGSWNTYQRSTMHTVSADDRFFFDIYSGKACSVIAMTSIPISVTIKASDGRLVAFGENVLVGNENLAEIVVMLPAKGKITISSGGVSSGTTNRGTKTEEYKFFRNTKVTSDIKFSYTTVS